MSGISGPSSVAASANQVSNGAALSAAESVLGMSSTGLRVALQSGQRLMDIAATKGMDRATFITELTNAINKDRPDLGTVLASAMASRAAGKAVMGSPEIQAPSTEPPAAADPVITEMPRSAHPAITEMPRSAHPAMTDVPASAKAASSEPGEPESAGVGESEAGEAPAPSRPLLQQLSGMFNMSQRDLVASWSGGASPIQIAVSRGVAPSDLVNTFESVLRQSGSATLSSRAESLAQALVISPLMQGSLVSRGA